MIKIENLSKTYKTSKTSKVALHNINLTIEDKGLVFLTGKSGSGKSTLLNMLGGIDFFDEGNIIIDDFSLKELNDSKLDEYRNSYLGFVFQDFNIFEEFTVRDNILLASRLLNIEDDEEKLDEILKSLDLMELKYRYPRELSGGQRQRVAIARGLIKEAKIFLLDEPTGNLDSENSINIFNILKKISKDYLVIVVSHDEEYVNEYADRIITLKDGFVVSDLHSIEKENNSEIIDETFQINNDELIINNKTTITYEKLKELYERFNSHKKSKYSFINKEVNFEEEKSLELKKSTMKTKELLKISLSSLKFKPFRLILTILLTMTSFSLFGLSLVGSSYNKDEALYNTLKEGDVDYLTFRQKSPYGDHNYDASYTKEDLNELGKIFSVPFNGVFKSYLTLDITKNIYDENLLENYYYTSSLAGLTSISKDDVELLGYDVLGKYPSQNNEIMLTSYTIDHFLQGGYIYEDEYISSKEINASLLIDKPIVLDEEEYIICGILDTKINMKRYGFLKDSTMYEKEEDGMPYKEFQSLKYSSYMNLGYVAPGKLSSLEKSLKNASGIILNQGAALYLTYEYLDQDKNETEEYLPSNISNDQNSKILYKSKDLEENEAYVPFLLACKYAKQKGIISKNTKLEDLETELLNHKDEILKDFTLNVSFFSSLNNIQSMMSLPNLKVVGFASDDCLITNSIHYKVISEKLAPYYMAISPLKRVNDLNLIIETNNLKRYELNNQAVEILDLVNSRITLLAKVFKYVGIGSGIFSLLLLYNFISLSISYKHKDIGILKSLGTRKLDIHKIFIYESGFIALIISFLSFIAITALSIYINSSLKTSFNLIVNVYHLKFIHLLIVLLFSLLVAILSSIIPLLVLNKKTPLELLKNY